MSQQTAKQSNTEQRNIEQSAEYQKPALDKAGNLAELTQGFEGKTKRKQKKRKQGKKKKKKIKKMNKST